MSTLPAREKVPEPETELEVYGFAMMDAGYDFGDIGDPLWFDVLRPTKLPAFEDQFGKGGRSFLGARQSRFGVRARLPTEHGEINTKFEFELFGVGIDAGRTTFRLRHAYGEWKWLRAGQTWSLFMDPDVFPNSIEYWGPPGMVFFRNVQLAVTPWKDGDSHVSIAFENPGASADEGQFEEVIGLSDVVPRFPAPDVTARARLAGGWGHVQLAGISNYMNDATVDVGAVDPGDPAEPVDGKALPLFGLVAFVDWEWSKHFTSTAGYSLTWIDNSSGQTPDAFRRGHYALANLLFHPTDHVFFGPELQWGRRENNSDGFEVDDFRLQFSVKYSFSRTFGGNR
jgi:hypothetical protein